MADQSSAAIHDTPELNPTLDRAGLRDEFRRKGRVHIASVLTPKSAERLQHCLAKETQWSVTFNQGADFLDVAYGTLEERSKLALESRRRARNDFAFFHDSHALSRDGEPYAPPNHAFAGLVAFLNAPEFLGFVRDVTGQDEIALADAKATLFQPGDYRTRQDGMDERKNRLAAYEISMTPAWRVDWGGTLEFLGLSGHIEKGFVPTFNTLTLFAVPRTHFVSQVALHGGLRYAVSGWLRSGER